MATFSRFLTVSADEIWPFGGGKHARRGRVDVAMLQSVVRKGVVNDLVEEYGHVVVDEYHHISAASFERVVSEAKVRYITGLSATIVRKDGHHPIIFMQCGLVRYRVDDRTQSERRPFDHHVIMQAPTGDWCILSGSFQELLRSGSMLGSGPVDYLDQIRFRAGRENQSNPARIEVGFLAIAGRDP